MCIIRCFIGSFPLLTPFFALTPHPTPWPDLQRIIEEEKSSSEAEGWKFAGRSQYSEIWRKQIPNQSVHLIKVHYIFAVLKLSFTLYVHVLCKFLSEISEPFFCIPLDKWLSAQGMIEMYTQLRIHVRTCWAKSVLAAKINLHSKPPFVLCVYPCLRIYYSYSKIQTSLTHCLDTMQGYLHFPGIPPSDGQLPTVQY